MCYDTNVGKMHTQIWFIGRTLASQAGKAGSIPVICFLQGLPLSKKHLLMRQPLCGKPVKRAVICSCDERNPVFEDSAVDRK